MAPTNLFHLIHPSTLVASSSSVTPRTPLLPLVLAKRSCVANDGYVCYHLPIPAVIGIILGAVFFLLNVILFTFICVKWRRSVRKRRERERNGELTQVEVELQAKGGGGNIMGYQGHAAAGRVEWNPHAF